MSKKEQKKFTHINVEYELMGVWTKASVSSCRGLLVMGRLRLPPQAGRIEVVIQTLFLSLTPSTCGIQPNDAVSYHLSDVMDAVKNHNCSSFACDHRAMSGVAGPR
uniref:Uncharacterized protein n=1 Tax=Timema genevievae TaxID=629358 RepID=A0A7R9JR97_TIMGE|nr:unnamed protein product [Timema genevievae]